MADCTATSLVFGSEDWMSLLRRTLVELTAEAGEALDGVDFSICEVFTDAPPDGGERVWAARIKGTDVEFFDHAIEADFNVCGDFAAILPIARVIYAGATEADLAALIDHRERMVAEGRLTSRGDLRSAGKPLRKILQSMHDRLARRTL
jgi:hypothetical protein